MNRSKLTFVAAVALVLMAGGWLLLSAWSEPLVADEGIGGDHHGNGSLDGLTFSGALGPDGEPKDIADVFVFENGTFVSKECEIQCKFPPRPYFERTVDGKTEFISETKCPYKNATIVWRGTVSGEKIEGVSTWTVSRWYWTIERKFEFAGVLASQSTPVATMK